MSNGGDYTTPCRGRDRKSGCGKPIVMSQRSGKWAPYEQDGTFHNCPNRPVEPQVQRPTNGQQQIIQQQPQSQQGNKVPRTNQSVTKTFEGVNLSDVARERDVYVNIAEDYGAQVYGSSMTFAEGKGTWAMVVWLNVPKSNVQYLP